jgi:hypothetical protein
MRRRGPGEGFCDCGGMDMMVLCCAVIATGAVLDGWRRDDPRRMRVVGLRFNANSLSKLGDGSGWVSVIGLKIGDDGCSSVEFFLARSIDDGLRTSTI